MKFLLDAQLPRRLAARLREAGHEAIHTLDLSSGNRTSDSDINELSISEGYVVVTKDADFVNSFLLHQQATQIATGLDGQHPKLGTGIAAHIKSGKHR